MASVAAVNAQHQPDVAVARTMREAAAARAEKAVGATPRKTAEAIRLAARKGGDSARRAAQKAFAAATSYDQDKEDNDVLQRLPTHMASRIDDLLPHRWQPSP